jgi:diadenosine tetraphosphate (Ap4A) HIT family hydrolase
MKGKKVVDPRNAKSGEYSKVINTIASEAKCPFCPDNFKYHKNPILKKEGLWFITQNSWPYQNSKYHFVIIGDSHKERFAELTAEDWESIRVLINWAIRRYKIPGGGIAMRFGETTYTGATVVHLHAHLIVPEIDSSGLAIPVNFPLG